MTPSDPTLESKFSEWMKSAYKSWRDWPQNGAFLSDKREAFYAGVRSTVFTTATTADLAKEFGASTEEAQQIQTRVENLAGNFPQIVQSEKGIIEPDRFGPMCASVRTLIKAARSNDLSTTLIDELEMEVEAVELDLPAKSGDTAWMVERLVDGRPAWWDGGVGQNFSHDPNKGCRYKSRFDALFAAKGMLNYTLTEHAWI